MTTRKKIFTAAFSLVLVALVIACAGRIAPPVSYPEDLPDYDDMLDRWTEDVKIYEEFETKIIMTATLLSSDMLRAYAAKHCEYYLLDQVSCAGAKQELLAGADREYNVFMAFFTADAEANDLDIKDTLWKIYLEGPGESRVLPVKIERVREKVAYYEAFYPYVKPWQATYRIKFARQVTEENDEIPAPTGDLRLIVTGPIGQAVVEFELN
jgi:hypothetical protein